MDFKVTGWFERNYKLHVAVIVILITISAIIYYLIIEDKSDTFMASSIYALTLFCSGGYSSYMSNKIDERFQDRIEIYINLQKVENIFQSFFEEEFSDYDITRDQVITFQSFTLRSKKKQDVNIAPYIKERGFKFDAEELEVEDAFLELYHKLSTSITEIIKKYIEDNKISFSAMNVFIYDVKGFIPDVWCKKYLKDYETEGENMVNHIYDKLKCLDYEYSRLELLNTKVYKLYSNYFNMTKLNMKQIQKMYGRKLQYKLSQYTIQNNFNYLFRLLESMEDRMTVQIQENGDRIDSYVEYLDTIIGANDNLFENTDEVKGILLEFCHQYLAKTKI